MVMGNKIKKIIIGILCAILLTVIMALTLFFNELRSLASLKIVDDYPMYQMIYLNYNGLLFTI